MDLTANEINIMKKKQGLISVVLYCWRVPCIRQGHEILDQVAVHLAGIDEVGHAEPAPPGLPGGIDVDPDDPAGADQSRALDDIQADPAKAEDDDVGARLDPCRIHHGADPRGHAATNVAGLVEGRVRSDLRHSDLWQDGVVGEGRATHVVGDRLALVGEPARTVGHQALALCGAYGGAQVGLPRQAAFALTAFRRVERNDMVARLNAGDPGPDLQNDPGAFMAQDGGEHPLRVEAVQGVGVRMTDAGGLDLHQNLAGAGSLKVDLDDLQWALGLEGDGGAGLHSNPPAGGP